MMSRALFVGTFLAACLGFSCVYAAYRSEVPSEILRRTLRYFLTMAGGFLALGLVVQGLTSLLPALLGHPDH